MFSKKQLLLCTALLATWHSVCCSNVLTVTNTLCSINTSNSDSSEMTELHWARSMLEASYICSQMPMCRHVLRFASASGSSRHFAVLQENVTLASPGEPTQICELASKESALIKSFKQLDLCPKETVQYVQPMQMQHSSIASLHLCLKLCISQPLCEFVRYNSSCYTGILATFMVSRAAAVAGCSIYKKIREYDDKFLAFFSFNSSLNNLVNSSRYCMTNVGNASITADGVNTSETHYVTSTQNVKSLRQDHVMQNKHLSFVIRMKRTAKLDPGRTIVWVRIVRLDNFIQSALQLYEEMDKKTLKLIVGAVNNPNRVVTKTDYYGPLPYPNQENWICAAVSFNITWGSAIINGEIYNSTVYPISDSVGYDAGTWERLNLGYEPTNSERLRGFVQTFAIMSGTVTPDVVQQLC